VFFIPQIGDDPTLYEAIISLRCSLLSNHLIISSVRGILQVLFPLASIHVINIRTGGQGRRNFRSSDYSNQVPDYEYFRLIRRRRISTFDTMQLLQYCVPLNALRSVYFLKKLSVTRKQWEAAHQYSSIIKKIIYILKLKWELIFQCYCNNAHH
jgi:hypothetical protein